MIQMKGKKHRKKRGLRWDGSLFFRYRSKCGEEWIIRGRMKAEHHKRNV